MNLPPSLPPSLYHIMYVNYIHDTRRRQLVANYPATRSSSMHTLHAAATPTLVVFTYSSHPLFCNSPPPPFVQCTLQPPSLPVRTSSSNPPRSFFLSLLPTNSTHSSSKEHSSEQRIAAQSQKHIVIASLAHAAAAAAAHNMKGSLPSSSPLGSSRLRLASL